MRISDWSSDVCSSDLQDPGRARRKRLVQLVANISLPLVRARLAVHSDSDGEQHGRSEDRAESFGQLTARAADPDKIGCRRSALDAGCARCDLTGMNCATNPAAMALAPPYVQWNAGPTRLRAPPPD